MRDKHDPIYHDVIGQAAEDSIMRRSLCVQVEKGPRSDNTSGVPGVSWQEDRQRWYAYIRVDGKMKSLGRYVLFEDAVQVRKSAAIEAYGDFAREAQ